MKRGKEDWAEKRAHRIVNTCHDLNDAYDYIARALRAAERRGAMAYGHHRKRCKGFPAISQKQLDRDCDCGFTQILRRSQ